MELCGVSPLGRNEQVQLFRAPCFSGTNWEDIAGAREIAKRIKAMITENVEISNKMFEILHAGIEEAHDRRSRWESCDTAKGAS